MLNSIMENEKRKDPRRIAKWHVEGQDKNGRKIKGITENVSMSGLLLTVYDDRLNVDKGSRIYIEIKMVYKNIRRTIKGVVLIRHSAFTKEGKKLGVEFIQVPELERKLLKTFAVNKI